MVTIKQGYQFFSSKTFMANNEQLTDEFVTTKFLLGSTIANNVDIDVTKVETKFTNRVLYQDQLTQAAGHGTTTYTTYTTSTRAWYSVSRT